MYPRLLWGFTIVALLYSAFHFVESGVRFPLREPNLGKFEEETPALREHLRTGLPVDTNNPVQYGPAFFFVVHPLIVSTHSDREFAGWLYAIQIACLVGAFALTVATLKPFAPRELDWRLVVCWLAVLWLNFSPLYATMVVKTVETWELFLITLALWAYLRERLWVAGAALAAAGLVKILPLIFVYYLLVTNRRAFVRTIVALAALLALGQLLYGTAMGAGYLPHVVRAAAGNSYGLRWHENVSIKAAVTKAIGRLERAVDGKGGHEVLLTAEQLRRAIMIGDALVIAGLALLTWSWLLPGARTRARTLWEWSLTSVVLLMLSPNTTFEYATIALGALSYVFVRELDLRGGRRRLEWPLAAVAMLLLGVLLPRRVLNRVAFVETINNWTGIHHLLPSEAYQYYCFPLAGLLLLTLAIWKLRPAGGVSASAASPGSTSGSSMTLSFDSGIE